MKKVAIISTVGVPACYGGYETLVENLLTHQQNKDIKYQVYCSSASYKEKRSEYKGAVLKYLPFKANGAQGIIYDSLSLFHAYMTCDVIMSLGTVGCFWLPVLKLFSKKKVIVNLDGIDDKREKWGRFSRFVIGGARKIAAKYADEIIGDNKAIQDYISRTFNKKSVLIEYGGDNASPYYDENKLSEYGLSSQEYIFKVARIEPENKIDIILEAFARIPEEKLVIVGNWNTNEFGRGIREKYSSYKNIIMLDPIYEPKSINLLRSNCKLYIHGNSAGGTNPSLVEAMYLGLPIIASDVVYNRSTTEEHALYFSDVDSLISQVKSVLNVPEKLLTMREDMKSIAERRYTWKIITNKYESLY
ncbi:MAG: DUF1972 domain-containing protein [Bacteroidales bacterium]|nr:DUF1972 domain-containing protein [Bacteroidales bacterium]